MTKNNEFGDRTKKSGEKLHLCRTSEVILVNMYVCVCVCVNEKSIPYRRQKEINQWKERHLGVCVEREKEKCHLLKKDHAHTHTGYSGMSTDESVKRIDYLAILDESGTLN